MTAEAWTEQAVCREVDPDLWFPEGGNSTRQAVKFCDRCPVRDPCLAYALATEAPSHRYGIWGGLTSTQRGKHARKALEALEALERAA